MAGKISQLKDDATGDYLYPVTTASSVYMEDNTVVEARIKSLESRRAETIFVVANFPLPYFVHLRIESASVW